MFKRDLGDGRTAEVIPLTFGRARIIVYETGQETFIDDGW